MRHSIESLHRAAPTRPFFFSLALWLSATISWADDEQSILAGPLEKVVGDCEFTEGPAWHPDGFLLFSDIPNNRIIRVNTDEPFISDWTTTSEGTNGIICDQQGRVYACQGGAKRVVRLDGTGTVVASVADMYEGQPFNQPNDVALDGQGGLYFTDPNYGGDPSTQPEQGVYYVSAEGTVTRVLGAANFPRPNGILVTPDGSQLLVANIEEREIIRYAITAPGQLSEGEVIFTGDEELDGGGPDGMALDSDGRIYATYKTVVVLSPDGELISRIEVPEQPANCTIGGPDRNILYITARTSLYAAVINATAPPLMEAGPEGTPQSRQVTALDIVLDVPGNWEEQTPTSNLRLAQFSVPPAEEGAEPTEYVVFPPFGGTREDNIGRWIDQFDSDGRQLAMVEGTCPQGEYVLVDLSGTYEKPDGPPVRMQTIAAPGYRMLGVILTTETGNYFIKMVGPAATIEANIEAFRLSFGADADSEMEFVLQ